MNQTLEMYLRCFTSSRPKEWVQWVPWAEFCYNTSLYASTCKTPFEVVYGREPPQLAFLCSWYIKKRIGLVAYRLDLLQELGTTDKTDSPLPLLSETSGHLQPQPIAVLNSPSNGCKRELLIQWQVLPTTDAT
ncbi:hypothetical protein AAG906_037452 [Vitis piasezkii]